MLTSCGKIENKFDIGEISDIEVSISNDISMAIKGGTLTNKGATIIITNNSDKDFIYGNPYEIEIKKDGYGKLASGTYRVIKIINYEFEEDNYQTFNIAVEFNITND